MEHEKRVKKKVTFSDYDEIEIIDEWALVCHTSKVLESLEFFIV